MANIIATVQIDGKVKLPHLKFQYTEIWKSEGESNQNEWWAGEYVIEL